MEAFGSRAGCADAMVGHEDAVDVMLFDDLAQHAKPDELLCGRASVPGWPNPAGWRDFLLGLDEPTLCECERRGLHHYTTAWNECMPATLRALCESVRRASVELRGRRPDITGSSKYASMAASRTSRKKGPLLPRKVTQSKAAQVRALAQVTASRMSSKEGVQRIVDVGCGRGHLLAELQAVLGVNALGIDRNGDLLKSARELYPSVEFEAIDVFAGKLGPILRKGDLLVGLHPCGLLGERLVEAVAPCADVSLIMVPCCLHKQGGAPRPPRSVRGRELGLTIPCAALKKASMALDASATVGPRRNRHALRALLRARGVPEEELVDGNEMDGLRVSLLMEAHVPVVLIMHCLSH